MDDFKVLEARIATALDQIGDRLLQQTDLVELEQRLAQVQSDHDAAQDALDRAATKEAALTAKIAGQAQMLAAQDADVQQLRATSADLTELCAQLRRAATDGIADVELINRALLAEVEGLTAQRAAEANEIAAILSDLKPLLQKEA